MKLFCQDSRIRIELESRQDSFLFVFLKLIINTDRLFFGLAKSVLLGKKYCVNFRRNVVDFLK